MVDVLRTCLICLVIIAVGYALAGSPEVEEVERDD